MIPAVTPTTPTRCRKPRASGDDPLAYRPPAAIFNVNPARAGMILEPRYGLRSSGRKPRASGDDPSSLPESTNTSL